MRGPESTITAVAAQAEMSRHPPNAVELRRIGWLGPAPSLITVHRVPVRCQSSSCLVAEPSDAHSARWQMGETGGCEKVETLTVGVNQGSHQRAVLDVDHARDAQDLAGLFDKLLGWKARQAADHRCGGVK